MQLGDHEIIKGKCPYCGNKIDSLECRVYTEKIVTLKKIGGIEYLSMTLTKTPVSMKGKSILVLSVDRY